MEAASLECVRVQFTPQAFFLSSARNLSILLRLSLSVSPSPNFTPSYPLACLQATVGSNGRPSNRTVVFRGFQENSDKIQIHTDRRSHKIEELWHCPFAEICWYFTDSWEQFRINGRVEVIDETNPDSLKLELREKAWYSCSTRSRLQYLGPSPGLPNLSEEPPTEASLDPSTGPVASFCLLILDPEQVDYLNLKTNQRLAFMSRQSANEVKGWTSERINP